MYWIIALIVFFCLCGKSDNRRNQRSYSRAYCEECGGSGGQWEKQWLFNNGWYKQDTFVNCGWCKGSGYDWIRLD